MKKKNNYIYRCCCNLCNLVVAVVDDDLVPCAMEVACFVEGIFAFDVVALVHSVL